MKTHAVSDKPSDRKAPGFWFYPADYERDVQMLSLSAQGLWMRLMCWMSENEAHRGFLELPTGEPMTKWDIGSKVGKTIREVEKDIAEMEHIGIFSRDDRGCMYCRRMARETHISAVRRAAAAARLLAAKRAADGTFAGDFAGAKQPPKEEQNPTVTASVSASVSDVLGSPTHHPVEIRASSKTDFDFHDRFERIYARHPKKGDRGIAERYLSESAAAGLDMDEFDAGHTAWCDSEEWRWKNGAKAPKLAQFILDKGWKYPPPEPQNDKSALDRLMEAI